MTAACVYESALSPTESISMVPIEDLSSDNLPTVLARQYRITSPCIIGRL